MTANEQTRLQVLNQVMVREVAVGEAANVLGLSERHTWRLLAGYRKEGAAALVHGNRGRPATNAIPDALRAQVLKLATTRYEGLNQTHFTEMLAEREDLILARSTVRNILRTAGIASPRRRRPARHRTRRERMPQEGMLLQLDGSHHRWLQHRGPHLVLLLAIDDATGTAPYALFREREDTVGYLNLLKTIVERHGIPAAVYTDRHAAFIHRDSTTQAARVSVALKELGVRQILAMSPEAKGRVERANGTFQDRLVSELRLAGARTLEQANEVLWEFLPRFNARFGVPAAVPAGGYRPVGPGVDIEKRIQLQAASDRGQGQHGQLSRAFAAAAARAGPYQLRWRLRGGAGAVGRQPRSPLPWGGSAHTTSAIFCNGSPETTGCTAVRLVEGRAGQD